MVTISFNRRGQAFALLDRGASTPRGAPGNRSCELREFTRSE
jgi:hypothetical protein